jgi:hypothetical protein
MCLLYLLPVIRISCAPEKQCRDVRFRYIGGSHLYRHNPSIDQRSEDGDAISLKAEKAEALCSVAATNESLFSSNYFKVSIRGSCKGHVYDDPRR